MYMDGLKYQNTTLNNTLKFSLKGPVRTHHYLNTYIRFIMNAQQQANHYYKTAFDRWALELSYEKNHLIAKSIASYVVEEMIKVMNKGGVIGYEPYYWGEVLEEINKIRGYEQ